MSRFDPMQAADAIDQLVATITGFRAKLIEAGFSPEASEDMAVEFCHLLLDNHRKEPDR